MPEFDESDRPFLEESNGFCDKRTVFAVGCVIATFVALGIPLAQCEQRTRSRDDSTSNEEPIVFFRVPIHMQETDYTCGPSSLLSVLYACNIVSNATLVESDVAAAVGTTSAWGTNWTSLVHYSASINNGSNISVGVQFHLSPTDVRTLIRGNSVVIIGYQAWKDPNEFYPLTWDDGHYSVVIGYNATGLVLMDPWQNRGYNTTVDAYGYMTDEMLLRRWHFNNGGAYNGLPLYGLGLSLRCDGLLGRRETVLPVNELRTTW